MCLFWGGWMQSLFDICWLPGVEISLGVTPVGLLWFSLPVPCMKGVLEGSRISFQTLMQHHFITDHCQGYVIWWNHMKPLWLFLGRWLQSLFVWHMLISQGWNQPWCHTCGSIRHFFIGSIDPAVAWAVAADNQHPRVQSEVTNFQKHTTSACWWSLQDPYGRSRMVGAQ